MRKISKERIFPECFCSQPYNCLLFIYLRARKRGFSHDPSGMALSHVGLDPVSRIGVTQHHPHIRHQGLPKQTLPDGDEG